MAEVDLEKKSKVEDSNTITIVQKKKTLAADTTNMPEVPGSVTLRRQSNGLKRQESHVEKIIRLENKWEHLGSERADNSLTANHTLEMIGNEEVTLIHMMMQPLVASGAFWMQTIRPIKEKKKKKQSSKIKVAPILKVKGPSSLDTVFHTKIKKITGHSTQAGVAGFKKGDYLHSIGGVSVMSLSYEDVKQLFKDAGVIGQPYRITVCRKKHALRDDIQTEVKSQIKVNKDSIRTFDKFITTAVTILYLLYPTLTKATFQLVACQQVGKRYYLQLDLDIPCYETQHMLWVWRLFIPSILLYVIGLPLMSFLTLFPQRHHLGERFTRFRFGVLFTGYTDECFYWETVIASRKTAVICVSVFMTPAGAEAQALCCMMIVMFGTVSHLLFRPFENVTEDHHTLFWSEFWGLQTAFLTFWTGFFFYQGKERLQTNCMLVDLIHFSFFFNFSHFFFFPFFFLCFLLLLL